MRYSVDLALYEIVVKNGQHKVKVWWSYHLNLVIMGHNLHTLYCRRTIMVHLSQLAGLALS